jgi:RNA-binding protein
LKQLGPAERGRKNMLELSPSERRELRAKAHKLHPVVSVGQHGLTPSVLHEIDVNLKAHELIKVRVFDDDRGARESLLARICAELAAASVQHIGKLLVLWRPKPSEAVEAAKSTPQVRRPRTPLPRSPARPPAPGGSRRRPTLPTGGRKRRPHP